MIHLMPWPVNILEIGLGVFCFFDVLLAREMDSRWLPRWGWILAVLFFPLAGGIGWIAAGRHWRIARIGWLGDRPEPRHGPAARSGSRHEPQNHEVHGRDAQDTDATLALQLSEINAEHEQTLIRWEQQLRRREEALRRRELELQGRHADRQ